MGRCKGKNYVTSHVQAAFHDHLGFSTGDVQTQTVFEGLFACCLCCPSLGSIDSRKNFSFSFSIFALMVVGTIYILYMYSSCSSFVCLGTHLSVFSKLYGSHCHLSWQSHRIPLKAEPIFLIKP